MKAKHDLYAHLKCASTRTTRFFQPKHSRFFQPKLFKYKFEWNPHADMLIDYYFLPRTSPQMMIVYYSLPSYLMLQLVWPGALIFQAHLNFFSWRANF